VIGNLSANHTEQNDQWKDLGPAAEQIIDEAPVQTEKSETKIPD